MTLKFVFVFVLTVVPYVQVLDTESADAVMEMFCANLKSQKTLDLDGP